MDESLKVGEDEWRERENERREKQRVGGFYCS